MYAEFCSVICHLNTVSLRQLESSVLIVQKTFSRWTFSDWSTDAAERKRWRLSYKSDGKQTPYYKLTEYKVFSFLPSSCSMLIFGCWSISVAFVLSKISQLLFLSVRLQQRSLSFLLTFPVTFFHGCSEGASSRCQIMFPNPKSRERICEHETSLNRSISHFNLQVWSWAAKKTLICPHLYLLHWHFYKRSYYVHITCSWPDWLTVVSTGGGDCGGVTGEMDEHV